MIENINKPTTITIRNGYGKYSVSVDRSDLSISEMIECVRRVVLAAGYSEKSVDEYIEAM